MVYIGGCLIGFMLVAYNLTQLILIPIFGDWFGLVHPSSVKIVQLFIMLTLGTLTLPVTLKNELSSKFSTISQMTVIVIIYMLILLFVQIFSYHKKYEYNHSPRYSLFKWNIMDLIKYYGNYAYAFNCVASVFTMMNQLKKNNHSTHIRKIYLYTVVFLFFMFASMGVIGYAGLGNDASNFDLIIMRTPLPGSKDIPMKIGYLGIVFMNIVGFIMYVIPWKVQLYGFFKIRVTTCRNICITLAIVYIPCIIGWAYPYATKVFGIIGAYFGTLLVTTIPGILYLKYLEKTARKWTGKYVGIFIWCIIGTSFGLISGTTLLIGLFVKI